MPIEQDQAFYHLIYIQSRLDHDRGMMSSRDDSQILADAIEKVRDGLSAFRAALCGRIDSKLR